MLIEKLEDLEGLKKYTPIEYTCADCGAHVSIQYRRSIFLGRDRLLCGTCGKKDTCMKKYGVPCHNLSREVQEKKKAHCLEKYGAENPSQVEAFKEKRKNTMLERYGVEHALQNPELREKAKATTKKHYGVEHSWQADEVKEKIRKTNKERYGVEYPQQSEAIRAKSQESCLKHFGIPYILADANIKKKGLLEKYGVENAMFSQEIKDTLKQTLIDKYGVPHIPSHYIEWNGMSFDSRWELIFYKYWSSVPGAVIIREPCSFEYCFEGTRHTYVPDFYLKKPDDTEGLFEVKGDHFFKMREEKEVMVNPFDHFMDGLFEAKHQCALEHSVIFVRQKEIEKYNETTKVS